MKSNLQKYLQSSFVIDFEHPLILEKAKVLKQNAKSDNDVDIAKNCFIFVRDEIRHTGDHKDTIITCKASDVLTLQTGWCYAKSHLLAALCRANNIPIGFCYQKLSISGYGAPYMLHGFNAVYLKQYGWYRLDARGNKLNITTKFTPPIEHIAFSTSIALGEKDFNVILTKPLPLVITFLQKYTTLETSIAHLPHCDLIPIEH